MAAHGGPGGGWWSLQVRTLHPRRWLDGRGLRSLLVLLVLLLLLLLLLLVLLLQFDLGATDALVGRDTFEVLLAWHLLWGLCGRNDLYLVRLKRCGVLRVVHASCDLLVHLLGQKLLAEGAKQVRLNQDVEPDVPKELTLHAVQFGVVQHWEELRQRAVADRFVLPHLVRQQEGSEEEWAPSARMQRDVRALLESAQVYHTDDEGRDAEDPLMEDAQDKRADVQRGAVMHGVREDSVEVWLVVVRNLEEEPEHLVPLHPLQNVRVVPDVAVEEVDGSAQELRLQGTEALRRLTISEGLARVHCLLLLVAVVEVTHCPRRAACRPPAPGVCQLLGLT
mmetsp:Transcript_99135/g.309212  ORF Transcript_99135/g.309212 Transcript_99135/m.309212 type:complete len:336 (+) Transcript_99135:121-1128(+)